MNPPCDDPHRNCPPLLWCGVRCSGCGRGYTASPDDPVYCDARSPGHLCEACVVGDLPIVVMLAPVARSNDPVRHRYRPRHRKARG